MPAAQSLQRRTAMGYIREIEIAAPRERVWRAWSSAPETEHWLAPRANVRFAEGEPYEFYWPDSPDNCTEGCRLREIRFEQKLRFDWVAGSGYRDLFSAPNGPTTIEARFESVDNKTLVTVEQFETRSMPGWAAYDEWMADEWESSLQKLRAYCEDSAL